MKTNILTSESFSRGKVSLKEARLMLELMYNLAISSVNQVLSDERMTHLWTDVKQNELEEQYEKCKKGQKIR